MIMRATDARRARGSAGARLIPSLLPGVLAVAILTLAPPPYRWPAVSAPQPAVANASDEGLPGEGRPPSPGPTDPDDLAG